MKKKLHHCVAQPKWIPLFRYDYDPNFESNLSSLLCSRCIYREYRASQTHTHTHIQRCFGWSSSSSIKQMSKKFGKKKIMKYRGHQFRFNKRMNRPDSDCI